LTADPSGPDREEYAIPDAAYAARLIRETTFRPVPPSTFRIGVEAELIPIDRETRRVPAIDSGLLPALERYGERDGWSAVPTSKGAPVFELPGGGRLTFEPGGQIEYAAPPFDSPSAALAHLRDTLLPLTEALGRAGIDLYGLGVDPFNGPDRAELQIEAERYRCMDAYYARYGPAGARMMRQTASIQLNIDSPCDQLRIWQVLNALAPVLVATFANSRRYAGRDTGLASFRSWTWQILDRTRTGLPWSDADPVSNYAEFALDAPAMFHPDQTGDYQPFRSLIRSGRMTERQLANHLSTLFPEVRPRRYFEVRSVDALPLSMYAAPLMLLAGLTLEESALESAAAILGPPDTVWLARASRMGLRDQTLARRATAVSRLAIDVCRSRPDLCEAADTSAAADFYARFTEHGRSPADAADALKAAATAA
jgi:glutamate--cysteine ligase